MATVDISDNTTHQAERTILETLVPIDASGTWDAASIADGDEVVTEITATGAVLGDFVLVSSSIDVADLNLTAAVTAANTVTVQLNNNTGGAIDLASATYYVRVLPRANKLQA